MRGTRTVLALTLFAPVFMANAPASKATDDCLTKPNGPTPQGQHWYYRIDHANNGRQCWYLRAESAPNRKATPRAEIDSTETVSRTIELSAQRPSPPPIPEDMSDANQISAVPIPWLNFRPLPETVSLPHPTRKVNPDSAKDDGSTSTAKSASAAPVAATDRPFRNAGSQDASPAPARQERRVRASQPSRSAQTSQSKAQSAISHVDHTFALLMVLFGAIAIAGPALHFVERRRQREAISYQPPPWARVVALNAPTPRIRVARPRAKAGPPAPTPMRPPDQAERLSRALQQLIDRLQNMERPQPEAVRIRPTKRASM